MSETILTESSLEFGVEKTANGKLFINEEFPMAVSRIQNGKGIVALDVETDEKDNFVCISITDNGEDIYYYDTQSDLDNLYTGILLRTNLVGHNIKADLKWLNRWNCKLFRDSIYYDTMIASYAQDCTKETHGLKSLSKNLLGIVYPSYDSLVGKGHKRVTMDKQSVEIRSNYNGLDALVTYRLMEYFNKVMTLNQKRIFNNIEMPLNRILYEMETKGVKIDLNLLEELDKNISVKLKDLLDLIHNLTNNHIKDLLVKYEKETLKGWKKTAIERLKEEQCFNPSSWQQKRFVLETLGYAIRNTSKDELCNYKDKELVGALLQYSEFSKLYNGFIKSFEKLPTLPKIHTTFNQLYEDKKRKEEWVDLETTRLSSSNPVNLQQVPVRTEEGRKLRKLFVPEQGNIFIQADYSLIELRIAAHFSNDGILTDAFLNNKDVHAITAEMLGVSRFYGKTVNFTLAYGAGWKKLMMTLNKSLETKITEEQAKTFVEKYWDTYKGLKRWKWSEIGFARKYGGINTIIDRWIPVSSLNSQEDTVRWFAERQTISKKISGSAADIIKLAMIKCTESGYLPTLTVHDELLFEVKDDKTLLETMKNDIKTIMESVVKLSVPLIVKIGVGYNWGECKEN